MKFDPCPICGNESFLHLSPPESYESIFTRSKYGGSCVAVDCQSCSLLLYEHTQAHIPYEEMVERLAKRWNSIKR